MSELWDGLSAVFVFTVMIIAIVAALGVSYRLFMWIVNL